jgi:hypothetical protein
LVKRLEFRHTPKHGSCLNIAENELSALTRRCVGRRRFGTIEELRAEAAAWSASVNAKRRGLAVPHRRRPHQAEIALPEDINLTLH